MQFKITFWVAKPGKHTPESCQFELSSWINKRLEDSSHPFASYLRENKFVQENKSFKFFTFSNFRVRQHNSKSEERRKIFSREVSVTVSFLVPEEAEDMLIDLFSNQYFKMGNKDQGMDLHVKHIEVLPKIEITEDRIFLCSTSPILVSKPVLWNQSQIAFNYLSPLDPEFDKRFFQNLFYKHHAAARAGLVEPLTRKGPLRFRLPSLDIKQQQVRINIGQPSEKEVTGYEFDFELIAPKELIRTGMLCGFGEDNSLGLGSVRVRKGARMPKSRNVLYGT